MTRPLGRATAFAPGSIGNVGPGFDVLGLAYEGAGDSVTVELTRGEPRVEAVTGVDSDLVPRDPERNCAAIAAHAHLAAYGYRAVVTIDKGLPLAAGMGGSAASSVAGAYAAALALGQSPNLREVIGAALIGEAAVAGRHLDNIAASAVGGLALSRSVDPIDVVRLPVAAPWWVVLVRPHVRVETRQARALLPDQIARDQWIAQMANTIGLAQAFGSGDGELLRRSLDDRFAEPRRAELIPRFHAVKQAALDEGALGCSISGSGPTIFAVAVDEDAAHRCGQAMQAAFGEVRSTVHAGAIAKEGVRRA